MFFANVIVSQELVLGIKSGLGPMSFVQDANPKQSREAKITGIFIWVLFKFFITKKVPSLVRNTKDRAPGNIIFVLNEA